MRRPPVVLGMALVTCLALLAAVLLILFSVNPSQHSNQREIEKAVVSQHAIICAQVQNTANAYRFRSLTPSGEVEPIRHFLTRMQAQAQTLRLARGAECKSAPGFPPVGLQVKRALHQIREILMHFEPVLRKPVSQKKLFITPHNPPVLHKQQGFWPALQKPPRVGVDENGVPATLKHQLAPNIPLGPLRHHHREKPMPPPVVPPPPTPVEPRPEPSPPSNPHATNTVASHELEELPIKVEINLTEGINVNVP